MKKITSFALLLALAFTAPAFAQAPVAAAPAKVNASAPIEKKDATGKFQKMHTAFLERGKAGPMGVLFLGDSITEGWKNAPHIWEHYYGKLNPANFGIGGDSTQHVIWRIANGELDGIHPKVVVLMLGTNNSGGHTADEIFAADKKIIELIHAKIPETKVLLLAIFPRDARKNAEGFIPEASILDNGKRTVVINDTNAKLAKLDNGGSIRFLNINSVFLGRDGKIPWLIMPDQLHPTAAGYQLWAEAMQPLLTEMLK